MTIIISGTGNKAYKTQDYYSINLKELREKFLHGVTNALVRVCLFVYLFVYDPQGSRAGPPSGSPAPHWI